MASKNGRTDIVQLLLEAGANNKAKDYVSNTTKFPSRCT